MKDLLIVLSILALVGGLASLSQATLGVGLVAVACLFAIHARIAQAEAHQRETRSLLASAPHRAE